MKNGAEIKTSDYRIIIVYTAIFSVFIISCIRAHQQSLTHDEVNTYRFFVTHGIENIRYTFDSNNHTLHSLLMRMSTLIFGVSHLSLRLPALLGGLLYCLISERLCRELCRSTFFYIFTVLVLTANPFIWDFMVVARGYSLALGFFMTAFLFCWIDLKHYPFEKSRSSKVCINSIISCLCYLSVSANLSFAFLNASLIFVFFISPYMSGTSLPHSRSELCRILNRILLLIIPGTTVYTLINPAIFSYEASQMHYGHNSWYDSYRSLLLALFDDFNPNILASLWKPFSLGIMKYLPVFFVILILLRSIFDAKSYFFPSRIECSHTEHQLNFRPFLAAIFFTTTGLHTGAQYFFNVPLPADRTGIFFIPLSILLASISLESFSNDSFQRFFKNLGRLRIFLSLIYFLSCFHINHFRNWTYDGGSEDILLFISSFAKITKIEKVRVSPIFEPSLNFYRVHYGSSTLPVFEKLLLDKRSLSVKPSNHRPTLFVLHPRDIIEERIYIEEQNLNVLYRDPISQAVVSFNILNSEYNENLIGN